MASLNVVPSDLGDIGAISLAQQTRIDSITEDDDALDCITKLMSGNRWYTQAEVLKALDGKRSNAEDRTDLCSTFKQMVIGGYFESDHNSFKLKKTMYYNTNDTTVETLNITQTIYDIVKQNSDKTDPSVGVDAHEILAILAKLHNECDIKQVQGALNGLVNRKYHPLFKVGKRPSVIAERFMTIYSIYELTSLPNKTPLMFGKTEVAIHPKVVNLPVTPSAITQPIPTISVHESEAPTEHTEVRDEYSFDDLRVINAFKKQAGGNLIEAYELFKLKKELMTIVR
jgi:hypothetical protein